MAEANALYQLETGSQAGSDASREGEAGDPGGGGGGEEEAAAAPGPSSGKNSTSPTEESPSKKRSGEREVYTFIQELDQERWVGNFKLS